MRFVLIVEDELDVADALRELLQDEACEVDWAGNGRAALAQIRTRRPDLILLDLMMPVMDGAETLAALKEDESLRTIPVIVMSAGDGMAIAKQYHCAYLRKPFDLNALLALVAKVLRHGESAEVSAAGP